MKPIIAILLLLMFTLGQQKPKLYPRFVIHSEGFIYQNHADSEIIYFYE